MIGKGIKFQYLLQNCEINLFGYHGNHEKCKFSIEINGKSIFFNNGKSRIFFKIGMIHLGTAHSIHTRFYPNKIYTAHSV